MHGASHPSYEGYGVRYIDTVGRRPGSLSRSGRRRTPSRGEASHPNLLIAHDRYVLDEGFFDGFDRFGYDFDLCAVRQTYEDGESYPAYCALNATGLLWAPTVHCENYNVLHATQYVNGGLMVFKTHALRELKFNDLLYWNQAEDVEVSRVFIEAGMPPRMNYLSSATTIGIAKAPPTQWRLDQRCRSVQLSHGEDRVHRRTRVPGTPLGRARLPVLAREGPAATPMDRRLRDAADVQRRRLRWSKIDVRDESLFSSAAPSASGSPAEVWTALARRRVQGDAQDDGRRPCRSRHPPVFAGPP